MTASLLSVLGLALIDSINPSALGVTMFLLLSRNAVTSKVLTYIAGVFVSYFVIGLLLMVGLESVQAYLYSSAAYAVQGVLGFGLLVYSIFSGSFQRLIPKKEPQEQAQSKTQGSAGLFLLGITVTALEFVTAFPYLGAIGILTNEGLPFTQWLPVLLIYNIIFILPPLALLLVYKVVGERLEKHFAVWQARLQKEAKETLLWIAGIVGFFLLRDSLMHFGFFERINIPFLS